MDGHCAGFDIGIYLGSNYHIHREQKIDPFFPGVFQNAGGSFHQVFLYHGAADSNPFAPEESVGHGAADEDLIHLMQQVFDGFQLAGDLGTTDYGNKRTFRIFNGLFIIVDFLFQEQSGHGRGDKFRCGSH